MTTLRALLVAAPILALLANCGTSPPSSTGQQLVTISAAVADLSINPIMGPHGQLVPSSIKGVYGTHCKAHAGEQWSLRLNDPTDNSLQVAINDTVTNCPLTLTSIVMQSGGIRVDYSVDAPIVLGRTYASEASRVNEPPPTVLAFYANAKLNGLAEPTYTNNFAINLIYSDSKDVCNAVAPPAVFAQTTATANGSSVAPPSYAMSFEGLQIVIDKTTEQVIDRSTGYVVLALAGARQPGEEWKIFDESSACCRWYTFAEIDAIYSKEPIAAGTISNVADQWLPWTSFGLLGRTLPGWRTIIVKHTGAGQLPSYELFQLMFPGAVR